MEWKLANVTSFFKNGTKIEQFKNILDLKLFDCSGMSAIASYRLSRSSGAWDFI
jgi:hypothetical protein